MLIKTLLNFLECFKAIWHSAVSASSKTCTIACTRLSNTVKDKLELVHARLAVRQASHYTDSKTMQSQDLARVTSSIDFHPD